MTLTQFAEEPDQEQRIAKLRDEIKKLGGDTMTVEDMPADMEEEILRPAVVDSPAHVRLRDGVERGAERVRIVAVDDGSGPVRLADVTPNLEEFGTACNEGPPVNARLMAEGARVVLLSKGLSASVEVSG